jgi:hypothetical protein
MRRRPWLVALAVGIAVLLGLSLLLRPTIPWVLVDWPGLYCLALVGAAVAHQAGPALGRSDRAPPWSLALALHAPAVFGLRVVSLLDDLGATPIGQCPPCWRWARWKPLPSLAVRVPLASLATRNAPPPCAGTRRPHDGVPTNPVAIGSATARGLAGATDHLTTEPRSLLSYPLSCW